MATAAVLQQWAECTNKIFINARPRQQQMGILLIMMMRSDKWAVVTAAELNCQNIGGWGPHPHSVVQPSSQSEAGIWVSWPIRSLHWVQPRSRSVTIFHSRDLSARITTVATREPGERQQHFEKEPWIQERAIYLIFCGNKFLAQQCWHHLFFSHFLSKVFNLHHSHIR